MKKTLKEVRKEKGFTQQRIADELGVNIRTYRNWEDKSLKKGVSVLAKKALISVLNIDESEIEW